MFLRCVAAISSVNHSMIRNIHRGSILLRRLKSRRYGIPSKDNQESVWKSIVCLGALGISTTWIVNDKFVTCIAISGRSMQPTFNPDQCGYKDWVLLKKFHWNRISIPVKRGDIVTFRTPHNPDEINIKRLIALEGDSVLTLGHKNKTVRVPNGHCWVEGDNHAASDDSNRIGPIPLGLITGIATRVFFPLSRWQTLTRKFPHDRVKLNPDSEDSGIEDLPSIDYDDTYYRHRT